MSEFDAKAAHKTRPQPETATGDLGTAKRNIQRKAHKGPASGGGNGKKGQWNPTDDGSTAQVQTDVGDPSYDPTDGADDENYILVSDSAMTSPPHDVQPPWLTLAEFKQRLNSIVEEYFLSEDVDEVIQSIKELQSPCYHYEIVKRGINMSLDRKDRERELVSKLLSVAYPGLLDSDEVGRGFKRLFEMIDDIQIDAPNARTLVASFLARAVVDEILPPSFLRDAHIAQLGGEIVDGARRLLSREHVLSRVERVWGPGDGRPVEELKVAIDQLLAEYLLSRQFDEAGQCVKELNCALFHHEIVKRAIQLAMDQTEQDCTAMSSLLAYFFKHEIISGHQMEVGFDRLHELITDLVLDMPHAPELLEKFQLQAIQDGCLPKDYVPKAAPTEPNA